MVCNATRGALLISGSFAEQWNRASAVSAFTAEARMVKIQI